MLMQIDNFKDNLIPSVCLHLIFLVSNRNAMRFKLRPGMFQQTNSFIYFSRSYMYTKCD